ncbi:sulfotransferase family protein [Rhodoligotrophos ferricapiens]|uniref:sulfotransferase family protein n=1 Tax=Rhodoligotrophos ferricapiens TaxID=3069264 RepID=UPI00315D4D93
MTAHHSRLPDFFIVGAMKAGTTTLYDCLRNHPDLYLPEEKEPYYFLWADAQAASRFRLPAGGRLIGADHWMLIRTETQYRRLFARAGDHELIGEASTFYLPDPKVPMRIKHAQPNARIIAILRDPVDRAYSAYCFQQSLGLEPAASFRAAIEAELRGERDEWLYGWRHLHCGRYASQVERYFRTFGEDRVLVLDFEDLKRNSREVARRVLNFLEVDADAEPADVPPSNVTALPRSYALRQLKFLFSRPNPIKDTAKHLLPRTARRQIREAVFQMVAKRSDPPPPLSTHDRAFLEDLFAPERRRLASLVGARFATWACA